MMRLDVYFEWSNIKTVQNHGRHNEGDINKYGKFHICSSARMYFDMFFG